MADNTPQMAVRCIPESPPLGQRVASRMPSADNFCFKYMSEIAGLKIETIISLLSNGFDSIHTLLAVDTDKDLPLLHHVSLGQRCLLRKALVDLNNAYHRLRTDVLATAAADLAQQCQPLDVPPAGLRLLEAYVRDEVFGAVRAMAFNLDQQSAQPPATDTEDMSGGESSGDDNHNSGHSMVNTRANSQPAVTTDPVINDKDIDGHNSRRHGSLRQSRGRLQPEIVLSPLKLRPYRKTTSTSSVTSLLSKKSSANRRQSEPSPPPSPQQSDDNVLNGSRSRPKSKPKRRPKPKKTGSKRSRSKSKSVTKKPVSSTPTTKTPVSSKLAANTPARRLTKSKAILVGQVCAVCGDDNVVKLYLGLAMCNGCLIFMGRVVRQQLNVGDCKKGHGQCLIDPKSRTKCRHCRYNKAVKAGLVWPSDRPSAGNTSTTKSNNIVSPSVPEVIVDWPLLAGDEEEMSANDDHPGDEDLETIDDNSSDYIPKESTSMASILCGRAPEAITDTDSRSSPRKRGG